MSTRALRIGYDPYSPSLQPPGDRRRFVNWARSRGVPFELADPQASYDVVVLSARADISRWARLPRHRGRIVYDLIDSYLTVPAWSARDVARGIGKSVVRHHRRLTPSYTQAVIDMCRRADVVLCSTPEQQADISRYCADVRVILDIHDEVRPVRRPDPVEGQLRLFWEGLPQNLAGFRPAVNEALRQLTTELDVSLHVTTDATYPRWLGRVGVADTEALLRDLPVPTTLHAWSPDAVADVAAQCDVGLIPLDLTDAFAAGKPENKLLIMWQLGLPVVASATPAYLRTMGAAGLDDTCVTPQDWVAALRRLADPGARARASQAGLDYVRKNHDGEDIRRAWDALFADLTAPAAADTAG